jgi:hypothetical protein
MAEIRLTPTGCRLALSDVTAAATMNLLQEGLAQHRRGESPRSFAVEPITGAAR